MCVCVFSTTCAVRCTRKVRWPFGQGTISSITRYLYVQFVNRVCYWNHWKKKNYFNRDLLGKRKRERAKWKKILFIVVELFPPSLVPSLHSFIFIRFRSLEYLTFTSCPFASPCTGLFSSLVFVNGKYTSTLYPLDNMDGKRDVCTGSNKILSMLVSPRSQCIRKRRGTFRDASVFAERLS